VGKDLKFICGFGTSWCYYGGNYFSTIQLQEDFSQTWEHSFLGEEQIFDVFEDPGLSMTRKVFASSYEWESTSKPQIALLISIYTVLYYPMTPKLVTRGASLSVA
jgi:hypothetical protein